MQGIAQFIEHGGWVMYTNICVLVTILAIIVERFIYLLGKGQINAKGLLDQLRKLIQANNVDRAIRICGSRNAPLLRIAKNGLVHVHRGEEAIANAVEEGLVETTPEVKKRISALWSLANIAVLVGLFGTVLGLIRAFSAVSGADPAKRQELLAAGIAEALHNTALGLGIAVVAIIFHLILSGMSKNLTGSLEGFSMKLENFLIQQVRSNPNLTAQAPAAASGKPRAKK